jgi:hypothetical protein
MLHLVGYTYDALTHNVKSPNNISKWQMGFNSAFKGLILHFYKLLCIMVSLKATYMRRNIYRDYVRRYLVIPCILRAFVRMHN